MPAPLFKTPMDEFIPIDFDADIEFDLDSLLEPWLDLEFVPEKIESPSPDEPLPLEKSESPSSSSLMSEIERFLLDNDTDDSVGNDPDIYCDFFSDLFADRLDSTEGVAVEKDAMESGENEKENDKRASAVGAEDEDPISKKRRRQMRNRDSAMKSRERKKMFVKDLQTKSKFLESECRRLDFALQCCMAENLSLRQRLQKERPLGAHMAKQESAVLFMESLLLVSLFWLMSIVCLFLVPGLPIPERKDVSRLGGSTAQEVVWTKKLANEAGSCLGSELVKMRRRCRGMRTKMKTMFISSAYYFCLVL